MHVPCKLVHFLDCDPDHNLDRDLDNICLIHVNGVIGRASLVFTRILRDVTRFTPLLARLVQ